MSQPLTIAPWLDHNGVLLPSAEARVSPLSPAFQFGHGLFETIRLLQGRPVFFADHHRRLSASALALRLAPVPPAELLRERIERLAARTANENGNVRLMLFQGTDRTEELIVSRSNPYSEEDYARGFRLTTLLDSRGHSGSAHKTMNHLKNTLARRQAAEAGFDDALFVSEGGEVFEAGASNLFVVSGGVLLTPPVSREILPGVARRQIVENSGLEVREDVITRRTLERAHEVFLTNALMGVMPVSRVDERTYFPGDYVVTPRLGAAFRSWQMSSVAL